MRTRHFIIALFIVLIGHTLAVLGISLMGNNIRVPVSTPILLATLITAPALQPEKLPAEIPIPPKTIEPKKETPPVEKKKPELKPLPVIKPKKVITVETTVTATTTTVAMEPPQAPKAVEPPPEPAVVPPRVNAQKKDNSPPDYPSVARRMGQQGTVILDVFILADGSVGKIRLKTSSGFPRLDDAATEAVKQWHYIPASRGDKPIDYWFTQPVKFVLN